MQLSNSLLLVQIGGHLAEEIGVYQWTSIPDRCLSTVWKYGFTGFAIIDFVRYMHWLTSGGEKRKLIARRLLHTTHNSFASPTSLSIAEIRIQLIEVVNTRV